ncbi:LysR family transcriptional regulator [Virgibacillus siamensis]|uniref:LysR family transcriptional regulator n=1 Tax=Virgibacillus siamensis TaxID=480071 RepID=UPI000987CA03|nr:LysR family transcriptional regulator [Virgibacillus siamensis]
MDIQKMNYFITLVDHSSFSTAASKLHISQPSLSMSIKKFEEEMGIPLIDRTTKKLELTNEGKIIYSELKKLVNHYNYVISDLNRLKTQGPQIISMGLIESSKYWTPKVIKLFKNEFENVHIKLFDVLGEEEVQHALSNYKIDLAITNQYINDEQIKLIPIYDEKLIALFSSKNPLAVKDKIRLTDLQQQDFIICKEGYQTRDDILNAFRKSGIKPNIRIEIEGFEMACRMVEENLGISIVPESYVNSGRNDYNFHIRYVDDPNLSRSVYLAIAKKRYLSPTVSRFITLIYNYFGK